MPAPEVIRYTFYVMLLFAVVFSPINFADEHNSSPVNTKDKAGEKGPFVENSIFSFRMIPRSAEQMVAFYEARGFPESALEAIKTTCFITAIVRNKDKTVTWTELKNWRFFNSRNEITRLDRNYWHAQWEKLGVPQSSRSTFDWTLMPETRDLQPYEPAGGNVIIPYQENSFNVEAVFFTGQKKRGSEIRVQFNDLHCPKDKE